MEMREQLLAMKEDNYASFSKSLIPGETKVLGVRIPKLRALAKDIVKGDWRGFLDSWSGEYLEEFLLRAFVISYAKVDTEERLVLFADFIPLIDNWSVCDSFCMTWNPKAKEKDRLWSFILPYLHSGQEFRMRYAAVTMLHSFIDDEHVDDVIREMDAVRHDGYYIKMAVAWVLSVCFAKYPEKTLAYLEGDNGLDAETMKMTAGKIRDSYRVSDEMKRKVRAMVYRC